MRPRSATAAAFALVLLLPGCATIDWAMAEERQLVGAIFESAPFNAPVMVDVDAKLPADCEEIVRTRSPAVWVDLTESGLATMKADRASGCTLVPAGRSAKAGGQMEWQLTDGGGRWRVPVGVYSIEGTNDDSVIMTRSLLGSTEVRFPWRFGLFTKLDKASSVRAVAAARGHKGNAVVKFDRTAEGWRVSSMSLGSPP